MKTVLLAGAGSFAGGILRYLISRAIPFSHGVFPYATCLINVAGAFGIGLLYGLASRNATIHSWLPFAGAGVLGGFTTFSAFSFETVTLFREGNYALSVAYVSASLIGGLVATHAGIKIAG